MQGGARDLRNLVQGTGFVPGLSISSSRDKAPDHYHQSKAKAKLIR